VNIKTVFSTISYLNGIKTLLGLGLAVFLIGLILIQVQNGNSSERKQESKTLQDPCWFIIPEGIEKTKEGARAYKEYSDRQRLGYPENTPIDKAVKTFNEEAFCGGPDKQRSPLSEDELISAVADEVIQGIQGPVDPAKKTRNPERTRTLKEIWLNKMLPKGSLIVSEKGYTTFDEDNPESGSYEVACWKIYLYLGLDKRPEKDFLNPEQVCLIRRQSFSVRHVPASKLRR
jgi:hypothetical protein